MPNYLIACTDFDNPTHLIARFRKGDLWDWDRFTTDAHDLCEVAEQWAQKNVEHTLGRYVEANYLIAHDNSDPTTLASRDLLDVKIHKLCVWIRHTPTFRGEEVDFD